ncbi:MAG: aminoglycoside phosphotransferase family protein [Bacteroidetes bacterium]|nr:aminoglycoside phosphotransferase family protein [Bacteroidota bacterium]
MLDESNIEDIFSNFSKYNPNSIKPYGSGHINKTYLAETKYNKYILQKVNENVFDLKSLINNYEVLDNYILSQGLSGKYYPPYVKTSNKQIHHIDSQGSCWRLSEFLDDSTTYQISPSINITHDAGIAMGKFQKLLNGIDPEFFSPTIPDFHNPQRRLNDYLYAVEKAKSQKKEKAAGEISFANSNTIIAEEMSSIVNANHFMHKLTHNDTKLENILFRDNNYPLVIDLDTVMPGNILFDFGDMVRSITSIAKEDEKNLSKVEFNIDHFQALARGYFTPIKSNLHDDEKNNIYSGILSVIYVQGIRFLTDFLLGNIYYKTSYENHNLDRTKTQFKLLQGVISKQSEIATILDEILV